MKKIRLQIDKSQRNANGEYTIYIVVTNGFSKRFLLKTGLTTPIPFKGREFPKAVKNSSVKTSRLNRIFSEVEEYIYMHEDEPMANLKESLSFIILGKNKRQKAFVEYMEDYMKTIKAEGTRKLYATTCNKIRAFDDKADFDTINAEWLRRFEKFCSKTMSVNGMSINFRNIRAVFNYARRNEFTDKYPFINYKIKHEETRKRSLSVDIIRAIRDYKCRNAQIEEYRDIFLLMFYLIGINAKDLLLAEKDCIVNGRFEYRRAKTGKLYSIKIEKEAKAIIDKYCGKERLLSVAESYKDYLDYVRHMNDSLKNLGREYHQYGGYDKDSKPLVEGLSTYYARHSWATIAAELDITFETISAALGHSIANPTTAIYINYNMKKVDEANRKVIDFVNGD